MRRIWLLVVGILAMILGLRILTTEDCQTVSFDGQGGRVAIAQCRDDESGALPAPLAGLILLFMGIGGIVAMPLLNKGAKAEIPQPISFKPRKTYAPKAVKSLSGGQEIQNLYPDDEEGRFLASLEHVPGRINGWYSDHSGTSKLRYFYEGRWTSCVVNEDNPEKKWSSLFAIADGNLRKTFKEIGSVDARGVTNDQRNMFLEALKSAKIPSESVDRMILVPKDAESIALSELDKVLSHSHESQSTIGSTSKTPISTSGPDRIGNLERLKALLDSGALTQAEFDGEKARILGS